MVRKSNISFRIKQYSHINLLWPALRNNLIFHSKQSTGAPNKLTGSNQIKTKIISQKIHCKTSVICMVPKLEGSGSAGGYPMIPVIAVLLHP